MEGKMEVARNLLLNGVHIDLISKTTGLSIDEIKLLSEISIVGAAKGSKQNTISAAGCLSEAVRRHEFPRLKIFWYLFASTGKKVQIPGKIN